MSKAPSNPKAKAGAAVAAFAVAQAKKALENPETRQAIADQAKAIAGSLTGSVRGRQQAISGGGAGALASVLGQGKLERRVDNLRTSISALGDGRPDLAEYLAPVAASVEQIAASLRVAGTLPRTTRRAAHRKIDRALDDLEVGLVDAALPGSTQS